MTVETDTKLVETPADAKPPSSLRSTLTGLVMPSNAVTEDMIKRARVDDDWHFAANLNAMMQHGYCRKCGLTPNGCKREGCGA